MSTPFNPNVWFYMDSVDSTETSIEQTLSGWVNYTFRVIAHNEAASSEPSEPTDLCMTRQTVPHTNPVGVTSIGDVKNHLVVQWQVSRFNCLNCFKLSSWKVQLNL